MAYLASGSRLKYSLSEGVAGHTLQADSLEQPAERIRQRRILRGVNWFAK
jgi:hypothetical protein